MAWGTDKNSSGKHGGKKDPDTAKSSPDGAQPLPEPKHKKDDDKK
ncbi:hypothetical protein ABTX81_11955 [Kitasatospora sp. NPDC097605]